MSRSLTVGAILLTAAVSIGLYQLSYMVRGLEDELVDLNRALRSDREAIQVLHAEWAYLSRPEALQDNASRYLTLVPLLPKQIVTEQALADLPEADQFTIPLPLPRPDSAPAARADVPIANADAGGKVHLSAARVRSAPAAARAVRHRPSPPVREPAPPTLRPVMANAFSPPR